MACNWSMVCHTKKSPCKTWALNLSHQTTWGWRHSLSLFLLPSFLEELLQPLTLQAWKHKTEVQKHLYVFPLTIDGWRQKRGHNLPLAFLVLVEETLEAVKDGAAEHKRLPLVYHGHEQHHDGRPANRHREEGVRRKHVFLETKGASTGRSWLSYLGGLEGALTDAK